MKLLGRCTECPLLHVQTYANDVCQVGQNNSFTSQQIQRMKNMWMTHRVCTKYPFSKSGEGTTCNGKRFSSELAAICESKRAELIAAQEFTRVEPCPCGVVKKEDGSVERQWGSSFYTSFTVTRGKNPFTGVRKCIYLNRGYCCFRGYYGSTVLPLLGETCLSNCPVGTPCKSGVICGSGVCSGGTCKAPSCSDGTLNGEESDIDCGGRTGCRR